MYYLLIVIATILFSGQFILNRGFQRLNGSSLQTSLRFSSQMSIVVCISMLLINLVNSVKNGTSFQIQIEPVFIIVGIVQAASTVFASYCAIKAFKTANLSVYSMFSMLGGMLLPFVYGIAFAGEAITVAKLVCLVLIFVAITYDRDSFKSNPGAFKFYIAVFILNGMNGVYAGFLKSMAGDYNKQSYLAVMNIFVFVITFILYFLTFKKLPLPNKKELKYSVGYGVCNGVANLLLLIALGHVNASVQYPIVTGGVMVFSTIVAALQRDHVKKKTIIATVIAFIATVAIILPWLQYTIFTFA